ncbi:MAG: acetyl-CoA carboxylase biotin carboxyl carrier protein subunit, partial [Acidobacteriota bacterium]
IGDRIYNCFMHKNGLNYLININGRYFEVEKSSEYERNSTRKKGFSVGKKEIRARMPGRVKKILKERGEPVKEGEGVLVVEAMKMENEIKSPIEGEIKEMSVRLDKNLETGDLLFIVE